jgi:predicted transcriptional regulator
MLVKELINTLGLQVAAGKSGLERTVMAGYCGDLLSDVMGNAPIGCVWLTVQGHQNIVAVAVLREMAAIVITGGKSLDDETRSKADQEGIPLLMWPDSSFVLAGRLHALGVQNSVED